MPRKLTHIYRYFSLYFWFEGNPKVGKSQILNRFINNNFEAISSSTKKLGFKEKIINCDGLRINLNTWGLSEQGFSNWGISNNQYKKFHGIIIVFDLTNLESFWSLSNWIDKIERYENENKSIIIVGNKPDLVSERQVSFDEAKRFADGYGIIYIEVSALTGYNVQELFRILTYEAIYKLPNFKD